MKVVEHIRGLRKAQLQEYFLRWFPSETMTSDKDRLVERLRVAMSDPKAIREKYDRLPRCARDFLVALLTRPGYSGTIVQIRENPRGRGIESYEVETLIKNLTSEGWIILVPETSNGVRNEIYVLPEEIAEGLGVTVDVEYRDVAVMLSLRAFLDGDRPARQESFESLTEFRSIEKRIAALEDPKLREIVESAISGHGGILRLSSWQGSEPEGNHGADGPGEGSGGRLHRQEWREALEANFLGTTGVLSLKSYGIDLEEECLVVFQELVASWCRHLIATGDVTNDQTYSLGTDLLIDIRRLLEIARTEALEVTREGSVFKKTEEKIEGELLTSHYRHLFDGAPVHHILGLCKRLRLLDQGDRYLRSDPNRRKIWLKKRLLVMAKIIFELYQNDYRGPRWSFHQRTLRDLGLSELLEFSPGSWIPARPFLTLITARFIASLEERNIAGKFKELQTEDFHHETLVVPLDRLQQDLSYWVVHRLALAGFVDLGFREGNFHTLQVSSLGARLFKIDTRSKDDGKLVVNPDFEVLLFPGGKRYEETNYALAAFTERTGSEWVKRYRITPASVKRGVISGYTAEENLKFLESCCENPLPPNVAYSIKEWAQGIEPILRHRVLLLKARTDSGASQLARVLREQEIPHERVGELAIVLRGAKNERRLQELRDTFQNAGLILE